MGLSAIVDQTLGKKKNQILEKDKSLDRYMTDILEVQIKSKTMMINRKLEKEANRRT